MIRSLMHATCLVFLLCFGIQAFSATELKPLNGGSPFFLEDFKGKWVLINFWATWCGPCVDEIQTLNHFYDAHHDSIKLFAVNMDEVPSQEQRKLAKDFHLNYPSLDAETTRLTLGKNISAVPATFVFSPEGALYTVLYGQLSSKHLDQLVKKMSKKRFASRNPD